MGIDEQAASQPPGAMRGAIVGTVALVTVFAAASAPIPLYATWQQQLGLSASDVSMTIVMYLFGVLSVLFFAGSLSDASGRRPTVGAALACGVAGCLLFIGLSSGPMLQFARFVQGVSCALSMSATSAFVIDCTSERHRTFGMTIASTGYLIGLTVGSLGIGFFATVSTAYWQVFAVMAVIMLATMLALPFTPETVRNRITWKKAVKPMTHVPAHLRKLLPIVAGGYISTWSVGFFFQSLSTPASVDYFGASDPLIPSLVLALAMAPSALGGPVSARMGTRSSMIVGYIIMFGAIVALGVCMVLGLLVPYLVLEVVFAVTTGMILSSSLHMLISASTPQENASVVTLANLTGYIGSTVVSTIQTGLTATFDLATVYAFIALLAAISIVPGCISMAKHQR
ncbi:MAG: MFS transporter [Senegalimassilia sp.]|uniref:MFS transporter n=1 Tax=Senegalimassilia TaxID=1473205 RepID=UPI0023F3A38E|nr:MULTISPECIES: MFS transporter [Senegalimassilia]MDR3885315.1 MFS transporter [Senegalimassilia sp.]MDR4053359.1 MFS transporter [Senegalimassilia sp.]